LQAIAAAIGGSGINLTNQAEVSALIAGVAQSEGVILGQGVVDSVAAIIVASNASVGLRRPQNGATGDAFAERHRSRREGHSGYRIECNYSRPATTRFSYKPCGCIHWGQARRRSLDGVEPSGKQ